MTNLQSDVNPSEYKFNKLQIYFGDPLQITDNLTVYQPGIIDIVRYSNGEGENAFFSELNKFVGNSTQVRVQLWDQGIDWNKVSDYDLFIRWILTISPEFSQLMFGGLDFSKFQYYKRPKMVENKKGEMVEKDEICCYHAEADVFIDEAVFNKLCAYLRYVFQIYPKVEKAKGKITKQWIVDEDRMEQQRRAKEDNNSSMLLPLISACVNHPGFKYSLHDLKEKNVGIAEFMDSVRRLSVYDSTIALLNGRYSGMCDMSKVDDKLFDYMRDLDVTINTKGQSKPDSNSAQKNAGTVMNPNAVNRP